MTFRRKYRSLFSLFFLTTSLCAPQLATAEELTFPERHWQIVAPEVSQWSADALKQADAIARDIGTDAFLVVHRGLIVHQYGQVGKPLNLYSARKSVLSVLYGIAVDRKPIDLNTTLAQLGIDDRSSLTETEKSASVRQLLQARSGVYHPAAYETKEMKEVRPLRGSHAPGGFWYYNNWDFNVLGAIYQQLTNKDVFSAVNDELAQPLQFEDYDKVRDTQFVYEEASRYPAYVMRMSARDLARLGLLMARDGKWKDRQIISKRWVAESTESYSNTSPGVGYGYLWWVGLSGAHFGQKFPGPVFSARGNYAQFLIVDPVRDLVIVHRYDAGPMSKLLSMGPSQGQFNRLLKQILAAAPRGV